MLATQVDLPRQQPRPQRSVYFSDQLTQVVTITWFQSELCEHCQTPYHSHQHCDICQTCHSEQRPHCLICQLHHFPRSDLVFCPECQFCCVPFNGHCRCGQQLTAPINNSTSSTKLLLTSVASTGAAGDVDLDSDEEAIKQITTINTRLQTKRRLLPPILARTSLSKQSWIEIVSN